MHNTHDMRQSRFEPEKAADKPAEKASPKKIQPGCKVICTNVAGFAVKTKTWLRQHFVFSFGRVLIFVSDYFAKDGTRFSQFSGL